MGKILVVENEERLCAAILAYLESLGMDIIAMINFHGATSALNENKIDLVILDLELVNGSGLDLLKYIRESPKLAGLPVVVMTAWNMEPTSYEYLEPGDYLIKPFDMRVLDRMILQLLELEQNPTN